jgi:hypothetical protein
MRGNSGPSKLHLILLSFFWSQSSWGFLGCYQEADVFTYIEKPGTGTHAACESLNRVLNLMLPGASGSTKNYIDSVGLLGKAKLRDNKPDFTYRTFGNQDVDSNKTFKDVSSFIYGMNAAEGLSSIDADLITADGLALNSPQVLQLRQNPTVKAVKKFLCEESYPSSQKLTREEFYNNLTDLICEIAVLHKTCLSEYYILRLIQDKGQGRKTPLPSWSSEFDQIWPAKYTDLVGGGSPEGAVTRATAAQLDFLGPIKVATDDLLGSAFPSGAVYRAYSEWLGHLFAVNGPNKSIKYAPLPELDIGFWYREAWDPSERPSQIYQACVSKVWRPERAPAPPVPPPAQPPAATQNHCSDVKKPKCCWRIKDGSYASVTKNDEWKCRSDLTLESQCKSGLVIKNGSLKFIESGFCENLRKTTLGFYFGRIFNWSSGNQSPRSVPTPTPTSTPAAPAPPIDPVEAIYPRPCI